MAERIIRTRRQAIRDITFFTGAALLAACGAGPENQSVLPTAAVPGAAPEAQAPTAGALPAAQGNGGEAGPTEVPEVEIPRLNLNGEPGILGMTEEQKTEFRNLLTSDPEAQDIYAQTIKNEADRVIAENLTPNPVEQILVTSDQSTATIEAGKKALLDMQLAYKLAYAAIAEPDQTQYTDKAKEYVLAWARTNRSTGNPINETNFDRMWIAYDLIREAFTDSERGEVLSWIDGIAQTQLQTELTIGNTDKNNWVNHRDKLVVAAAILTGNQATLEAGIANYQTHMHGFYRPDGTTYDMEERDALVYQTYGVLPSVEMARFYALNGGPDLYRLKNAQGGSMDASVNYLLPFVRSEQEHIEFVKTSVQSDKNRNDYNQPWNPKNAVPVLESATFFNPILVQALALAAGKPPSKYPTFNSLVYAVQQP
jgi:hypothetical protein